MTDATDDTDEALARAAQGGDREAFQLLYRRYRGVVYAIGLARLPRADAGDLVQEVFLGALQKLHTLQQPGAFGGWLLRIARNRATDWGRRRRPTEAIDDVPGRPAPPRAEIAQVLRAVRALPEAYRETLLMRFVEGMTGPEIAARTGLTAGSVRVNLHRGLKMLREKLGVEVES